MDKGVAHTKIIPNELFEKYFIQILTLLLNFHGFPIYDYVQNYTQCKIITYP